MPLETLGSGQVRVLVVHNRYRSDVPSGENTAVDQEMEALSRAGVEVVPYIRSSDEIVGLTPSRKAVVPLLPLHSPRAVTDVTDLIVRHRADVLHLHNPYPLISLSVVFAAHSHGVPVVATLHNHRHSCMRGSYFRDGHACVLCRGKSFPWPGVQHGCYRDSRLQSVPMAAAFLAHRGDQRAVDRYVALTQAMADSILESGLVDAERVVLRPNSVPDPGQPGPPGQGLLFVGRLTEEKGVPLLLEAWDRAGQPFGTLTVVGVGPELGRVEARAATPGTGVVSTGRLEPAGVASALRSAAALVVPSTAPEALPLVVLEAFSHGRPVIAADRGGLTTVIGENVGWLTEPTPAALARALTQAAAGDLAARGRAARARYERDYSPDVVTAAQVRIYRNVIAERLGSPGAAGGTGPEETAGPAPG